MVAYCWGPRMLCAVPTCHYVCDEQYELFGVSGTCTEFPKVL